jgi:drug/metabolite transporter (DMT)-like permease
MTRHSKLAPVFFALAAVLLFSTGGLCIKWLPFSALHVAGLRSLIAAVFVGGYLARKHGLPTLSRVSRFGWFAALTYFAMITSYVFSMKLTTAVNAIFLQYTMPAWVLLGGALWLGERITAGRVVVVLLCLGGMILFFVEELQPAQWAGNLTALFSGFAFAALILTLRKVREHRPLDSVFLGNAIAGAVLIPLALVYSAEQFTMLASFPVLMTLLWLGVFQIGLAYLFYVAALQGLPAIEVAILSLIEPILNPLWVFWGMGETPGFWSILGGSIILISVMLRAFFAEKTEDDQ